MPLAGESGRSPLQIRRASDPGDVHLHFFGTSRLSYGERDWVYNDGDEIRIAAPDFSATLVNTVRREPRGDVVQTVKTC